MDELQKAKDKIAKLLALAEKNNSEGEAKAALLKARAIMAEYKLRPEQCEKMKTEKIVKKTVGIKCSKTKNSWAISLSAVIAKKYCCIAYRNHAYNSRMYVIGFTGLEDDFEICSRIFNYAYECVAQTCEEIFQEDRERLTVVERRKRSEAYGYAFCVGLLDSLDRQEAEHQEWGLVMTVPQCVQDTKLGRQKPQSFGEFKKTDDARITEKGYVDGYTFDPSTKLDKKPELLVIE